MTRLFDTALPPLWYFVFWVLLLASFVVSVRLFIVNPLVNEARALRAAIEAKP